MLVWLLFLPASGSLQELFNAKPVLGDLQGGSTETDVASPINERLTKYLSKLGPQARVGAPETLPFPGVFQIQVGRRYVYVTDDGRYAFVGDLLDLDSGTNLTKVRRSRDNLALIITFPEKDMVVYPATGEEQAKITVFTDTACPYCRKFHTELPPLQQAGVTVRYIAFPRAGSQGEAYRTMRRVWCADDRRMAMDKAKGDGLPDLSNTDDCAAASAVDAGHQLGRKVGIRGTPAIVLPNGTVQPGYLPSSKLLTVLGLGDGVARASKAKPDK